MGELIITLFIVKVGVVLIRQTHFIEVFLEVNIQRI